MRILIADDDATSRAYLQGIVETLDHRVVIARDGTEAWSIICTEAVDVVISDWVMPAPDGPELCRRVRDRAQRPYKYFILLTGNRTDDANIREATEAGVDDFLTKPADRDTVWMRLRVAERIIGFTREISQLNSLLPICSYCKRVRNDRDYWERIESYMQQHTGAEFSHSICPDCYESVVKPAMERTRNARDEAARRLRGEG